MLRIEYVPVFSGVRHLNTKLIVEFDSIEVFKLKMNLGLATFVLRYIFEEPDTNYIFLTNVSVNWNVDSLPSLRLTPV